MSGAAALDMSLDDLIKTNKQSRGGGSGGGGRSRGRGRSSAGPGPARRFPTRSFNRPAPYSPQVPTWDHDLFGVGGNPFPVVETEGKLYISNLDYGVSNEDIKELFGEVGDLKRYSINYDRSGRSKGTAEVVFSRHQDAVSALKRYNNVQLDGKPMKIEVVGINIAPPALPPVANVPFRPANGSFRPSNGGYARSGRGMGGPPGRGARGGGRGFGRGRGRGRDRDEKVSAEDLDAELDKYHTEAMQTN